MKTSITIDKIGKKLFVLIFYIALWQLISVLIDNRIVVAGPVEVVKALFEIIKSEMFITIIITSIKNILTGFIIAFIIGIIFAFIGLGSAFFRMLVEPLMHIFKVVPVASFIILLLIWSGSDGLSLWISFVIALPIIYLNVLEALLSVDEKLVQMADIFKMSIVNRVLYLYLLQIKGRIGNASSLALGMCFKAGIAAEVIGVAKNTLGEQIYLSKIYLETDKLFAWTLVIIILSYIFEGIIKIMFKYHRK